MISCRACLSVVDPELLPVSKKTVPASAKIASFVQEDKRCPNCGALVERKIDGELVGPHYTDKRAERFAESVAKALKAAKVAKAAKASDKPATKAEPKAKPKG